MSAIKKYKVISVVFVIISFCFGVLVIKANENTRVHDNQLKREELSYLSSMMKTLAFAIDNGDDNYVKLTAAMIVSSGAVSYLDCENKENAIEFLNILSDGNYEKPRASAYARKCSCAAIMIAKGGYYSIGRYAHDVTELTQSLDSFEYKRQVCYSRKKIINSLSFNSIINGEVMSCHRGNVYYLRKINEDETCEYVYLLNTNELSNGECGAHNIKTFDKKIISHKDVSDFKFIFSDDGTSFFVCCDKSNNYMLGICEKNGMVTHFKKLN